MKLFGNGRLSRTFTVILAKAGIQDCSAAQAETSSGFPLLRE
jgi:hypothetical protein